MKSGSRDQIFQLIGWLDSISGSLTEIAETLECCFDFIGWVSICGEGGGEGGCCTQMGEQGVNASGSRPQTGSEERAYPRVKRHLPGINVERERIPEAQPVVEVADNLNAIAVGCPTQQAAETV